jgi:hypothetical protein
MKNVRTVAAALLLITVVGLLASPGAQARDQEAPPRQTNYLSNPGMEGGVIVGHVHVQDGGIRDNIFTPEGWVTWWAEGHNRDGQLQRQPEVQVISADNPNYGYGATLPRVHSGNQSLKVFTQWGPHDAGVYQLVTGLPRGGTVQLTAYAHTWSCSTSDNIGWTCQWGYDGLLLQVGIEPNGVCDPFSPSVVWGPDEEGQSIPDHFGLVGPVSARVGSGGSVCAFLRSRVKWAWEHLDAYWDDASLIVTSVPAPPTSPPTATPLNTPTPRPDGSIVHVVESGETLSTISEMYGIEVDTIRGLNARSLGDDGSAIEAGEEIVISPSVATATPEPILAVCVVAYHDRDGDQDWDEAAEEILPGALFSLAGGPGPVAEYVSDGLSEPYCFQDLVPGSYDVVYTPPGGYESVGSDTQTAEASADAPPVLAFGCTRGVGAADLEASPTSTPVAVAEVPSADPADDDSGSSGHDQPGHSAGQIVLNAVSEFSGVLMLCLAAGMGVLFYLERRKG